MIAPVDVRIVRRGIPELVPMVRTGLPENHISHVIRDMCVRLGHFAVEPDSEGERDYTLMELGSAFERSVVRSLAERYVESVVAPLARTPHWLTTGVSTR